MNRFYTHLRIEVIRWYKVETDEKMRGGLRIALLGRMGTLQT